MGKVTDVRGRPGDIVLMRSGGSVPIWRTPNTGNNFTNQAGLVQSNALGLIISNYVPGWTYVLLSNPFVCGWMQDGFLRVVRTK